MSNGEIRVEDKEVRELLNRVQGRLKNMTPVMKDVAGIMHDAVEENFEKEGRPRWPSLSRTTLERGVTTYKRTTKNGIAGSITRKSADRLSGRKMLQLSGHLAASIKPFWNKSQAGASTNDIKAGTHNFGAKKGQYGKTKHGAPIPWGDIPARPFMMLPDDGLEDVKNAIRDYLTGG